MKGIDKIVIVVMILVLVSTAAVVAVSNADGTSDSSDMVLIDLGNGETYWASVDTSQTTVGGVVGSALNSLGLSCTIDGSELIIDGISNKTIGSVSTTWKTYTWTDSEWVSSTFSATASYSGGSIAVGFYPSGVLPSETPDYMTSWIMARGDSTQSGHQTTDTSSSSTATSPYSYSYGTNNYVCGSVLVVADKAYVVAGGGSSSASSSPTLYCYDRITGEESWSFSYDIGAGYETATGVIVGDYYYLPATNGTLYRIPLAGPGDNNSDVISIEISKTYDHTLTGNTYATGPSTLTYDSGVLYFGSSNGYVYCVDLSLNVIWNTAVDGCIYYSSLTVQDGLVYAGALNGYLYVLNASTGEMLASADVYSYEKSGKTYGLVAVPVIVDGYIFMSFSDGQGMSTTYGGIAIYTYSSGELTEVAFIDDLGPTGTYLLPVVSDDFTGVYFTSSKVALGRMSVDGSYEVLNSSIESIKAGLILVNDDTIYAAEYNSSGYIYQFDMDGNITEEFQQPDDVAAWCMSPVVIIDDWIYAGTDGGFYSVNGELTTSSSSSGGISGTMIILAILICLIILFAIYCVYIKKTKNIPPIAYIAGYLSKKSGFNNDRVSKTKQNKRRLLIVLIFGVVLTFITFMCCLAFGPSGTISLSDAFSALISAIGKHGQNLSYNEIIVYESRLPRAIAALGVGIGLSIAGCIYQAIIRNPLVDPYIMGVSAGAGTFAVAVIAADFTFFGLLAGSDFTTPIAAIIGGLMAFGLTMLIAEKSGGSSTNYVLGGVVIGLAFTSVQTIMLVTTSSAKLHSAISWLYGSFANIGWDTVWLVFIPAVLLSLIPLFWAKELNLVLLGEDQAQQMGLNVRRFNRWMLILASVITSVCVAFVGIIGFVGLVIPHMCRMILGGDHRLVLPASIATGGALMLFADLLARMIMIPQELPVGAITTIIGIPLFAYLLIKKGRMYDG